MKEKKVEQNNIIKFQKRFQINVGFFLVVIIFLYIGFHVFSSLTKEHITIYEVEEGTIATNTSYQALAIRQEEVIQADKDGKLYFFGRNKSRVGAHSLIYAIDNTGTLSEEMKANEETDIILGSQDLITVSSDVDAFIHDYADVNFHTVYSFKSNLEELLQEIYADQVKEQFSGEISAAQQADQFHRYTANTPGLLCFYTDGFEGITLEDFDSSSFDRGSIQYTNLRNMEEAVSGQPIYKLITSDDWNLVMPIDSAMEERFQDMENIQIKFLADNAKTWARVQLVKKGSDTYLVLFLDDSMERYADQRFVNIELMLDSESGLKIPNSSITTKEFFVIPKSYFLYGADSQEPGLLLRRENDDVFVNPTIYYETEDAYYIDSEKVKSDDQIVLENSSSTYRVGTKLDQLEGVYSVNKGYTVFKQIEKRFQNEDYTVIKTGTRYGIALYDHIVLQADTIKENIIINK